MARPVTLNYRAAWLILAAGSSALAVSFASLQAASAASPAPSTNAPTATPPPAKNPVVPDAMGRYGKIVSPGDMANSPLRLRLPFPGAGEVKVPSADELTMREKLEQLSWLTDEQIRTQLAQWPAFSHMSLRDEGSMLARIQDFRDYHSRTAQQKAHDMGLLALTDDQKTKFEREYWNKRLQMDRDLARQFEGVYKAREQKIDEELLHDFASAVAVAQAPKPLVSKAATAKPAPNKPASATAVTTPRANNPATNAAAGTLGQGQPVADTSEK